MHAGCGTSNQLNIWGLGINSMSKPLFSRYTVARGVEAETQPGSRGRVLKNRRGITSKREIDRLEFEHLVSAQEEYYEIIENTTRFTASLIGEMHRAWLGGLYDWAGRYRNVELSKAGFVWPPAKFVEQNMQQLEQKTLSECTPCRGETGIAVAAPMAEVHAELLLVHPFREGNGRLARWLADLMALQAGFPLPEYGLAGRGSVARRHQYLTAVQQGYKQNYEPLRVFFSESLARAV